MKRGLLVFACCAACLDREGTLREFCRVNMAPDCPDAGTGGGAAGDGGGVATFTLTVSVSGPGRVSSDDAGVACPSQCSVAFEAGVQVTLTASATDGGPVSTDAGTFYGWSEDCADAGTAPICRLAMTAPRSATASFPP